MVGKIKDYNLKYYFLDITSDIGVPVCVCVLITQSETGERVSIGAGAGFSAEQILSSAFSEAISIMNYIHGISPITLHKKYEPFTDSKIDRDMRIRLYCNNEMFEKFKFFISSKETVSVEDFITVGKTISVPANDTRSQLVYLKKIFRERYKENKDYDVFVYKIKNKLLEEFDYKVVRIVCDGLYSLYLNENFADPNHPRLKEFVKNKGLEKVAKLNIWPHPFP
jgi:ribosomal protein S12 methylthiotransferase accessory factor YcaO